MRINSRGGYKLKYGDGSDVLLYKEHMLNFCSAEGEYDLRQKPIQFLDNIKGPLSGLEIR